MEYEQRKTDRIAAAITPDLKQRILDYINTANAALPEDAKQVSESSFLVNAVEFFLQHNSTSLKANHNGN